MLEDSEYPAVQKWTLWPYFKLIKNFLQQGDKKVIWLRYKDSLGFQCVYVYCNKKPRVIHHKLNKHDNRRMWTGIVNKMFISCFQSTYLPLSFIYIYIYMHIRHIWFPLRVQNMILECLVLGVPLLSPPLHCPLELQQFSAGWIWGGVSWRQAQCSTSGTDTHKHWAGFLCLMSMSLSSLGLTNHIRPYTKDKSQLHVFAVKKQFYLVMLKSFTWILQLCHDGAGNSASQLTAASVVVISAICYTDWGFLSHENRPP